jgi:hypothetical protein
VQHLAPIPPSPAAANGADLSSVVHVNEAAKQLVAAAFQVDLLALNAIVQSERCGGGLRSFEEVARHMKLWASELRTHLHALAADTSETVREVSTLLLRRRVARLLGEAARGSDVPGIVAASRAATARVTQQERAASRAWARLAGHARALKRLGLMACVLSRLAMIEAESGGSRGEREALVEAAKAFNRNAEHVAGVVQALVEFVLEATR